MLVSKAVIDPLGSIAPLSYPRRGSPSLAVKIKEPSGEYVIISGCTPALWILIN